MPRDTPQKHYLVDFAARYATATFKTFNAASALWRAEELLDDVEELINLSDAAEAKEIRFGSVFNTYEIVSYYAVALVTCLEWHARSRLVDLMRFKPNCIRTSDLKGIADLALSQMVASRVTVPELLGAATNVTSIGEYVAIFTRLFESMETAISFERQLRHATVKTAAAEVSLFDRLELLYETRNYLVHEISYSMIGHRNIREVLSLSEAKDFATLVIACIKLVEDLIAIHTPKEFPNRLTKDGTEESEFDKLKDTIAKVEGQITAALATDEQGLTKWKEALPVQKAALQKELEFLESAETLRPIRYYDVRYLMQTELLKSRLAFLLILKSETGH